GTVFQLTPPSGGATAWTATRIFAFTEGDPNTGSSPIGGVTLDGAGGLYGATYAGQSGPGVGVVFHLTPPAPGGTDWSFTQIATLGHPVFARPLRAPDGSLYVATTDNGT